jgi:hypothetical protein
MYGRTFSAILPFSYLAIPYGAGAGIGFGYGYGYPYFGCGY